MRESAIATIERPRAPAKAPLRLFSCDTNVETWEEMLPELQRAKEKTGARWTPEYIRDAILLQHACAFRFTEGGVHRGYLIVERISTFEVTLNCWVLVGDFGPDAIDRVDEIVALIDQLARDVGATRWRLETPRDGWQRVLHAHASRVLTVYERDL